MPELPEVEVTRQGLLPHLPGCRIKKILCSNKRLRIPIPTKLLKAYVPEHCITTVDRRAKYLLFRFSNGSTMVLHLGMSGKLSLVPTSTPRSKHDHFQLVLDNGMELRFNDTRRFGSILFWPPDTAVKSEREFSRQQGVEPFGRKLTGEYLREKSWGRKIPVKNFLMDSRIVAGIGNIYANEILFAVSINPKKPAGAITSEQWKNVVRATRKILKSAIKAGGSTISDFLGTSGNPGYFQVQFKVYNRKSVPCCRCKTKVEKCVLGGRATYFCPTCQPPDKL